MAKDAERAAGAASNRMQARTNWQDWRSAYGQARQIAQGNHSMESSRMLTQSSRRCTTGTPTRRESPHTAQQRENAKKLSTIARGTNRRTWTDKEMVRLVMQEAWHDAKQQRTQQTGRMEQDETSAHLAAVAVAAYSNAIGPRKLAERARC
jgi:hypothetical protein